MSADGVALADVAQWESRLEAMRSRWAEAARDAALTAGAEVAGWEPRLRAMQAVEHGHLQAGSWLAGPRSLLSVLGLQQAELHLTAGFAWLLNADGHHLLGDRVLRRLMRHVGIEDAPNRWVRVVLEETRGMDEQDWTRADLVVYGRGWTIVIEAKTNAPEQKLQLARQHRLWESDPGARFVFLTRSPRVPVSAGASEAAWKPLTWSEIAQMTRSALTELPPGAAPAPGVLDYVTTLEVHHHV